MKPNELKATMILLEVTTREIAKKLGVTDTAVSPVITGRRSTPRIRAAIAEALGLPVDEIWPPAKEQS